MEQSVFSEEVCGLPVDARTLFSNHKNEYKKGIEKRQTKKLKKLSFLKPFLFDDEKILMVSYACSPMTFLEQFLGGWMIFYLKRAILVFTDKRIFHIPAKTDYSYKYSLAHIFYADCRKIEVKGTTLVCHYKNNKKERFYYFERTFAKKTNLLLKDLSQTAVLTNKYHVRTHICLRCAHELEKNRYVCGNCGLIFKNKKTCEKISWIFPGGGYFYVRHYLLGIADGLVEGVLILWIIGALIELLSGNPGVIGAFAFMTGILVLEKLGTIYECTFLVDEYIPLRTADIKNDFDPNKGKA